MLCHFQNHLHSLKALCIQPDLSQTCFQDFWQDLVQSTIKTVSKPSTYWGKKHQQLPIATSSWLGNKKAKR